MYMFARTLPVLLFLSVLFSHSASDASGYRNFGVFYSHSDTEHLTSSEIAWLQEAGVTWLMVEEVLSDSTRNEIRDAGFSLYVMVPEFYPVPYRLTAASFQYAERANAILRNYRHDPAVMGFGLFAYGKWQQPVLISRLQQLADPYINEQVLFTLDPRPISGDDLQPFDGTVMLTRDAGQLAYQLAQDPGLSGILYAPVKRRVSVRDFQIVMQLLDEHRDLPVFFPRNWFIWNSIGDVSHESNLAQITGFYYRVSDARVANPAPDSRDNDFDLSIVFLLAIWGFFAAVYRLNPVYRNSIERFFLNYNFFVNDVLMRRIRLSVESIITFVLSAFLSGLIAYAIAEIYLDSVSREALLYHLRFVPAGWTHPMIFFFIFFILAAFINAFQIAWLRLANRQHAQTYQVATFILWPQYLNLLFVSIGVILLRSFPSEYIVAIMIFLYWTITLVSFFAAAYNMRRIHPTSPLYMALTYVLFILVSTSVLSWLVYRLDFISAWSLANSLASF